MDVINCAACGAEVNALAAGCQACGADPRTGEMLYVPPVERPAPRPQSTVNSVALSLAVAGAFLSLGPVLARFGVMVTPAAIIVGLSALAVSRWTGQATSRATLAIGIAAAALVFDLWQLQVFTINY